MSGDVRYELEPCGECSTLHITFTRRPSQGSRSHRHAHSTDTAHRRATATASVSTGERKRTIITRTPHLWPLWAFPFSLFMCALVCVRLRTCAYVRVCVCARAAFTAACVLVQTPSRALTGGHAIPVKRISSICRFSPLFILRPTSSTNNKIY